MDNQPCKGSFCPLCIANNAKCIECEHNSVTDGTGIHCEVFKCFIGDLGFYCAWGVKRDTQE